MLDIEKLKLTNRELGDIILDPELIMLGGEDVDLAQLARKCREAQLAKALWGLVDFIKEHPPTMGYAFLESKLAKAGIPRPETNKAMEVLS